MTSSYHDKEVGKTIVYKLPLFAIDLKFKKSDEEDIKKGGEEDIKKGGEEEHKDDIRKCDKVDVDGGYHNERFNDRSTNNERFNDRSTNNERSNDCSTNNERSNYRSTNNPHHKHSKNSYDNKHSKKPSDINLYNLIIKKRITLYDTLNKISDFAPVIYRFIIKNSYDINMYNIKNLLSSYLKEVDIDYNKAIKKNITVDTDWMQLYRSLL